MRDTGIHEDSVKIWKVPKTEPESHDITSLYLEGDDERLKKRRAGQWASIRVLLFWANKTIEDLSTSLNPNHSPSEDL